VLAIGSVDAGIGQHQALDGFAANYVRVDDLVHIGGRYAAIPDGIGIDDQVGSVLALVKAAGLVRAHFPLQATLGQFLLKKLLEAGCSAGITAAAGMSHWPLIAADKDVFLKLRHPDNVQDLELLGGECKAAGFVAAQFRTIGIQSGIT